MVLLRKYRIAFIGGSVTELRAYLDHKPPKLQQPASTGCMCTVPKQIQPNTRQQLPASHLEKPHFYRWSTIQFSPWPIQRCQPWTVYKQQLLWQNNLPPSLLPFFNLKLGYSLSPTKMHRQNAKKRIKYMFLTALNNWLLATLIILCNAHILMPSSMSNPILFTTCFQII